MSGGSRLTSSGLTSFAVPGGVLTPSNNGTAAKIALKTVAGTDPSPTSPLFVAARTNQSSGASFEGRAIVAPLSFTISSGSTFGQSNNVPFRIWDLLIDDAGTFRIGSVVCSGASSLFPLDESKLISSVAEGGAGAADSAGVVYTDVAVTSKPFRILGHTTFDSGLAAAGTWNVDPTAQMFGPGVKKPGELIQSIQNLSASVASGTTSIPPDATIPQSTEGDQYFSTSITPSSPANWIEHDILLYGNTADPIIVVALFQDSGANAIAAMVSHSQTPDPTAMVPIALSLKHRHQALTSSSTTFKIRAGANASNAFVLNALYNYTGPSSLQLLGGVMRSGHKITEFQA